MLPRVSRLNPRNLFLNHGGGGGGCMQCTNLWEKSACLQVLHNSDTKKQELPKFLLGISSKATSEEQL